MRITCGACNGEGVQPFGGADHGCEKTVECFVGQDVQTRKNVSTKDGTIREFTRGEIIEICEADKNVLVLFPVDGSVVWLNIRTVMQRI